MSEMEPLRSVLREWKAPEPPAELDARVLADFRATRRPWSRFWTASVTIPVPVLAAAAVLLLVVWLVQFRPSMPAPQSPAVVTKLEVTGFHALPDGVARVQEFKQ